MLKAFLRNIAIYTLSLYFLTNLVPGLKVSGGLVALLIGGLVLALMFLIIKPILNIISLPVNLLTLGLFSLFINALILYLATIFVPDMSIHAFAYPKMEFSGFSTPKIGFNTFFAYVYTAFVLSVIESFIKWLIK